MVERTLLSFPSQLQLIERLQHLLYLSSSITFISGEAGSGKSTLVEQLSNLLPDDTQQAFVNLSQPTSAAQIRQQIVSQLFEQPLFNAEDSLVNILLLLKDSQKIDVSRAVVIDNAGSLPESLLSELAEVIDQKAFITDHEFSFILLSDDSNTSQMARAIKQLPIHLNVATLTFKLAPLSAHEAEQLLNHRFEQIGYFPQVEHQDAIAIQLSRCKGIPGKILALATQISTGKLDSSTPTWLKTGLPALLVMLVLIAIAGGLGYYLYPKFITTVKDEHIIVESDAILPEIIPASEIIKETVTSSQANLTQPTDVQVSGAKSSEALAANWKTESDPVIDNLAIVGEEDTQARIVISEQQLQQLTSSASQSTSPLPEQQETQALNESPATPEASPIEPIAETINKNLSSQEILTAQSNIENNESPETALVELETEKIVETVPEPDVIEAVEVQIQEPPKDPFIEPKVVITNTNNEIFTDPETLLAINANFYTLQLGGFGAESSLKRFINKHQLPRQEVYLYQTFRNKKPWYVVIYGQFESQASANIGAKNLPDTLGTLNSWVKKYALVHQDLQRDE